LENPEFGALPVGWRAPREPTGAKKTQRTEFCSAIHRSRA
jgi:hypothetical protein